MQELWFHNNLWYFLIALVAMAFLMQIYISLRLKNILQAIAVNFETLLYCFRRLSSINSTDITVPSTHHNVNTLKTCQYCRHRLAYINTSKTTNEEDNFYHVCGLTNAHISPTDTCEQFDNDNYLEEDD